MASFDKEKKIFTCECGCGREINSWSSWYLVIDSGNEVPLYCSEVLDYCRSLGLVIKESL